MNFIEETRKEGDLAGYLRGRQEVALNLLEEGMDVSLILKVSRLSKEALDALRGKRGQDNS